VSPGEHFLLAQRPGFKRAAAVITVWGGNKLSEAHLFLEPDPKALERPWLVKLFDADKRWRSYAARLGCNDLKVDALAVMGVQGGVRLYDAAGSLRAEVISGTAAEQASTIKAALVLPQRMMAGTNTSIDGRAWYERWEMWTIVGGVALVGAGTALLIANGRRTDNHVSLVIGREP